VITAHRGETGHDEDAVEVLRRDEDAVEVLRRLAKTGEIAIRRGPAMHNGLLRKK